MLNIVLITGISGSGKSVALRMLEDSGYTCVDNLPVRFLHDFIAMTREEGMERVGIAIDVRSPGELDELPAVITSLRAIGTAVQLEKNQSFVEHAVQAGDRIVAGGARLQREGFFFEPTVIEAASQDSPVVREEVFGPVLSVQRFHDEDEAVRLANDTPYGLASGVWTQNIGRAHRMVRRLQAGVVHVNCYGGADITAPLAGRKQSGNGFDRSLDAIEKYQKRKTAWIRIEP